MGIGHSIDVLEMSISSEAPTLFTFSSEWKMGRFKNIQWDKKLDVQITTLDILIKRFGEPRHIKIDVEGHEFESIKGLTKNRNYLH
jgi:FkbM family methyltransferase